MRCLRRPCGNLPGWPKPNIALKNVSREARAKRDWRGWQHHQTLSLLATWFLVRETARGEKMDPCDHLTADSPRHRHNLARGIAMWHEAAHAQGVSEAIATQ